MTLFVDPQLVSTYFTPYNMENLHFLKENKSLFGLQMCLCFLTHIYAQMWHAYINSETENMSFDILVKLVSPR